MIPYIPVYYGESEREVHYAELSDIQTCLRRLLLDNKGVRADSVLVKLNDKLILCERINSKNYARIEIEYHPLQTMFS